jgi:hypothetical protein
MGQIIFRYIDLPCETHGFVREDSEGNYNIYINARMSIDMQREAAQHELNHVRNEDFDSDDDIKRVENL